VKQLSITYTDLIGGNGDDYDLLKPLTIYVHFVAVPKNLRQHQKALSNITFVVVILQIEGIVRGARNLVITMHP
jgi:hypothetical protein